MAMEIRRTEIMRDLGFLAMATATATREEEGEGMLNDQGGDEVEMGIELGREDGLEVRKIVSERLELL